MKKIVIVEIAVITILFAAVVSNTLEKNKTIEIVDFGEVECLEFKTNIWIIHFDEIVGCWRP